MTLSIVDVYEYVIIVVCNNMSYPLVFNDRLPKQMLVCWLLRKAELLDQLQVALQI